MTGRSPGNGFDILLVEDEPVIRELVRSMLAYNEVRVDCASNGLEGLKLARTKTYDLILLDVVLPQLDGIAVCRLLRAEPATAQVPLYMLTAKTRKADVDIALAAGANGYIQKPFRSVELIDLVSRLRR
jgi:two-component system, OmpR family, phosphate regulon response regulator PhoB